MWFAHAHAHAHPHNKPTHTHTYTYTYPPTHPHPQHTQDFQTGAAPLLVVPPHPVDQTISHLGIWIDPKYTEKVGLDIVLSRKGEDVHVDYPSLAAVCVWARACHTCESMWCSVFWAHFMRLHVCVEEKGKGEVGGGRVVASTCYPIFCRSQYFKCLGRIQALITDILCSPLTQRKYRRAATCCGTARTLQPRATTNRWPQFALSRRWGCLSSLCRRPGPFLLFSLVSLFCFSPTGLRAPWCSNRENGEGTRGGGEEGEGRGQRGREGGGGGGGQGRRRAGAKNGI